MSEYKLTIHLKQHTPMIHFQYAESGVVLRATDVKPKLDRFLITQYEKTGKQIPDIWKLPKSDQNANDALRYRMTIAATGNPTRSKDICKSYFGNMGNNYKETIMYNKPDMVTVSILCFYPDLLKHLSEHIQAFFVLNNFGTRQNKGFGSFTVSKIDGKSAALSVEKIQQILIKYHVDEENEYQPCYMIQYRRADHNEQMVDIADIYTLMKSGLNRPPCYARSFIYQYMHSQKGIGNEKAWMKQQRISPITHRNDNNPRGEHLIQNAPHRQKYVRALLGTPGFLRYSHEITPFPNKRTAWAVINIAHKSGKIKRVPSPILFKVIDGMTFIIPSEPNPEILGQDFSFLGERRYKYKDGTLRTPEKSEFLMSDFMEHFVRYINTDANLKKFGRYMPYFNSPKKIIQVKGDVTNG